MTRTRCYLCGKRAEVDVISPDRCHSTPVCDSCHRTYYPLNLFRRYHPIRAAARPHEKRESTA